MASSTKFDYEFSSSATKEYIEIVDFLNEFSHSAAEKFNHELFYKIELICLKTVQYALSRMKELADKGYRNVFFHNYVMLYKIKDNTVFIAHIFHQSRDYAALLHDDDEAE